MSFQSICEAWMTDLTSHVSELATATQHLYAPWSLAQLQATQGERHIAVYPTAEPEVAKPFVTGSPPADEASQTYVVLIWEDAASEATRLYDDDDANTRWLSLAESVRARFYVQANTALGESGAYTRYAGLRFDLSGTVRLIEITFRVANIWHQFT